MVSPTTYKSDGSTVINDLKTPSIIPPEIVQKIKDKLPLFKVQKESIFSQLDESEVASFSYKGSKSIFSCSNKTLYESLRKNGIPIPEEKKAFYKGKSNISFNEDEFRNAFYQFFAPKRFPYSRYDYTVQFAPIKKDTNVYGTRKIKENI